ncbi:DUF222 domain-containing protein [Epidermidibacterium keratini]|uniref:DUF222 domain-containing protein n=1 Tax=Epidermidibacterium keratini TaxID=1891644 RepID=A0A7L4YHW1_9ACTN|nr:HNH endonuclease signature motif containing protein [Epidermidibacterium keratini]QHB99025.1 DUF222 domain-containing protein [Epidermidibacterium keratini]
MGNNRGNDDFEQVSDLFGQLVDAPDLLDGIGDFELPDAADALALLTRIGERVFAYRDAIAGAEFESPHAKTVRVAEALHRLGGTISAAKLLAVGSATTTAEDMFDDPDAAASAPRPHVGGADRGDTWLSRGQLSAGSVGAVLGVSSHIAHRMASDGQRLTEAMPHARVKALNGEWDDYRLHLAVSGARGLSKTQAAALDEAVFRRDDIEATGRFRSLIERWKLKHAVKPESEQKHKEGMDGRYVRFGPVDLFGMRDLHGTLPAAQATAIDHAIDDHAAQAPTGDPRTDDQRRADTFMAMLLGPAALSPAVADQYSLPTPTFDPDTGYPVVDEEQLRLAAETWEAIRLLCATIGLTIYQPPRSTLDISVPLATLLALRAGITPDSGPPHPPDDSVVSGTAPPRPPKPGSTGEDCPQPDAEPSRVCPPPGKSTEAERSQPEGLAPDEPHDDPDTCAHPECSPSVFEDARTQTRRHRPDPDPRAWITAIGYLSYSQLDWLLGGCTQMRRIVTDDLTGAPLDLGPLVYRPTAVMRRRVQARDRHCRFPGCTRPAIRLDRTESDLDHTIAHRPDGTGGRTADAYLAVLCEEHHRLSHQSTWEHVLHPDGAMTWHNRILQFTVRTTPGNTG